MAEKIIRIINIVEQDLRIPSLCFLKEQGEMSDVLVVDENTYTQLESAAADGNYEVIELPRFAPGAAVVMDHEPLPMHVFVDTLEFPVLVDWQTYDTEGFATTTYSPIIDSDTGDIIDEDGNVLPPNVIRVGMPIAKYRASAKFIKFFTASGDRIYRIIDISEDGHYVTLDYDLDTANIVAGDTAYIIENITDTVVPVYS